MKFKHDYVEFHILRTNYIRRSKMSQFSDQQERTRAIKEFNERREKWIRDYERWGLANPQIGWSKAHEDYEKSFGQSERDYLKQFD